jgi:hypothetical protein
VSTAPTEAARRNPVGSVVGWVSVSFGSATAVVNGVSIPMHGAAYGPETAFDMGRISVAEMNLARAGFYGLWSQETA